MRSILRKMLQEKILSSFLESQSNKEESCNDRKSSGLDGGWRTALVANNLLFRRGVVLYVAGSNKAQGDSLTACYGWCLENSVKMASSAACFNSWASDE